MTFQLNTTHFQFDLLALNCPGDLYATVSMLILQQVAAPSPTFQGFRRASDTELRRKWGKPLQYKMGLVKAKNANDVY